MTRPRKFHCRVLQPLGALCAVLLALLATGCDRDPDVTLRSLGEQQEQGEFAATIEPLRDYLNHSPSDPEANFLYGRALVAIQQPSLASWSLREAMKSPEWRSPAGLQLAYASLLTGDFNESVEIASEILEDDPEDVWALLYRAQAEAHWKRDPEAALADAERALELDPELIEAYEPMILALLALDRHDEARSALAEAGERLGASDAPPSILAWHCATTAIFTAEAGEPAGAAEQWEECLERHPTSPNTLLPALEFYDAQGDAARPIELLETALEAEPASRQYRWLLALRLRARGDVARGEALLREATQSEDPGRASTAWMDLSGYLDGQREWTASAEAMDRAVEKWRQVAEPDSLLLFKHADSLLMAGRLDESLEIAEQIRVPAQQGLIRGRVAQERGDAARALEEFDAAIGLWPDNPYARYYAARAAEQLGLFDRALEEYRYSIRISRAATDARTRAAQLLVALGRPSLAYQLLFLEVGTVPLDAEGERLGMYLMGRVANPVQLQDALSELWNRNPGRFPAALASGAEGAAELAGPAAGLALLEAPRADYTHPAFAPALRKRVELAHAAGKPAVAGETVEAALSARPEAAAFHAARALHLELSGEPGESAAGYRRALEIDPELPEALLGLARVELERDPERSVPLLRRAAAAEAAGPEAGVLMARALRALGREEAAATQLDAVLVDHPYEAPAAALRVEIDLARDSAGPVTLERARRAARVGRRPEDFEQLSEVYRRLGDAERSEEAAAVARSMREAKSPSG